MATVLNPPRAPFARTNASDRASLSSFRGSGNKSNAPSITGSFSSLRSSRRSILIPSFLTKNKGNSKLASEPLSGEVQADENWLEQELKSATSETKSPQSELPVSQSQPQLRTSKSNKFMRRLTTKLRPNASAQPKLPASASAPLLPTSANIKPSAPSPKPRTSESSRTLSSDSHKPSKRTSIINSLPSLPSLPQARAVPGNSEFMNKDARTAALRERGLLPALTLSQQEARMDARIVPTPSTPQSGEDSSSSAADRIKAEWEAKNKLYEAQEKARMKNFRFGGDSPTSATPPNSALTPVENSVVCPPSPLRLADRHSPVLDPPPSGPPLSPLPSPPSSPVRAETEPQPTSMPPPSSPSSIKPKAIPPLSSPPSSPVRAETEPQATPTPPASPSSVKARVIPPPLELGSMPKKDAEAASITSGPAPSTYESAPQTPRSPWLHVPLPPSPLPQAPPSPGLTLERMSIAALSCEPPPSVNGSLIPPPSPMRERADSNARSEAGTVSSYGGPPSLSSSVPTMSTSYSLASESAPERRPSRSGSRSRDIPAIAESPTEDGILVDVSIPEDETHAKKPSLSHHQPVFETVPESVTPEPEFEELAPLPAPAPTKDVKSRRKSFNPFKRSQTLAPDGAEMTKTEKRKSGSNLRRAFTSNRPKPSIITSSPSKGYDASKLPPSPNLPRTFAEAGQLKGTAAQGGAQVQRRVSVFAQNNQAPAKLHNRASIIMEVNKIEDEESQRLTENAFLT